MRPQGAGWNLGYDSCNETTCNDGLGGRVGGVGVDDGWVVSRDNSRPEGEDGKRTAGR